MLPSAPRGLKSLFFLGCFFDDGDFVGGKAVEFVHEVVDLAVGGVDLVLYAMRRTLSTMTFTIREEIIFCWYSSPVTETTTPNPFSSIAPQSILPKIRFFAK